MFSSSSLADIGFCALSLDFCGVNFKLETDVFLLSKLFELGYSEWSIDVAALIG